MKDFNSDINALFLPLIGRIYTTIHFPDILVDEKVIEVQDKLPRNIKCGSKLIQYTYLSGSIRSKKIDDTVDDFLYLNKNGVVVQLNPRMSTACYRSKAKSSKWYLIDTKTNIDYRKSIFNEGKVGEESRINLIEADIFDPSWIDIVLKENSSSPILIVASGVFNYYPRDTVLSLLLRLYRYKNFQIIFDAVNQTGMKRMKRFYKKIGIQDYKNLFYVNNKDDLYLESTNSVVLDNTPFFSNVNKAHMSIITKIYMKLADFFKMINIIHISNENI